MPNYPYQADIELSRLRLDLRNPRVASEPDSQKEAFEAVAAEQRGKLLALARHIRERGLNPAQRFIVIPGDVIAGSETTYIVLDANRRLTALKALEQPDLMQGFLTDAQMNQLRGLADNYDPPDDVPCVVFAKREDADPWVELIHEGQGDGEGLVEWTAHQKARHRARRGSEPAHMQILDFVMREGKPSADTIERNKRGTYPVSTLERALSTPYLRDKLGIDIHDGRVVTEFPKEEVLKGLTKIVDEIGTGAVKVAAFMTKEQRAAYVNKFDAAELPDESTRSEVAAPLASAPAKATQARAKSRDRKHSSARTKMIPSDFSASIGTARINDIYHELKRKLPLNDVPNAAGVLFRTFLELSIDEYIRSNLDPKKFANKSLQQKVSAVLGDLEQNGKMSRKDMIPIRNDLKDATGVTMATNLNAFVHNPHMTPSANDLRAIWDHFAPLIGALWA